MKLLKFALFALTLATLAPLAFAGAGPHQGSSAPSHVASAMEPASWLLVGFGLVGGGFLHKRRHPGLRLVAAVQPTTGPQPKPTTKTQVRLATRVPKGLRSALHHPQIFRESIALPGKLWASLATALLMLLAAKTASADTINLNAQAVSTITLSPSSDTLSLNDGSGTVDSTQGAFTFQTGEFTIGDSEIPDQVVPFSFQDTITLNGITHTLTLTGQDAVTQTADTLTVNSSGPVAFGGELFTMQALSLSEDAMGNFPISLQATVTPIPTPEPGSLLLLGTGMIGGALFLSRKGSTRQA